MSTTGFEDGPPVVTGAQIGDSGNGGAPVRRDLRRAATSARTPAAASASQISMQDGVLNLCRVKLRDQQRLAHGPLRRVPERGVRRLRAALGQRLRRRAARLGGALQRAGRARTPGSTSIIQPQVWEPLIAT